MKVKNIIIAMFLGTAFIAGCSGTNTQSTPKIEYDPLIYVDLHTEGLNGYANGSIVVGNVGSPADTSHAKVLENTEYMLALTEYEISPKENLKNGDIVKITPIYDTKLAEEKGLKPTIRTKEVVVKNLREPKQVYDVAKDYALYYFLNKGNALTFEFPEDFSKNEFSETKIDVDGYFKVTPEKNDLDYKLGETITITFTYDKASADRLGVVFINTTYEQTITENRSLK